MGLFGHIFKLFSKHRSEPQAGPPAHGQNYIEPSEADAKAQLSFADGTINLFEDRLELKDLRGKKVRDVFYTQITGLDVANDQSVAKDLAVAATQGAEQAAANSTVLVLRTAVDEYRLDFRQETPHQVKRAQDYINTKIHEYQKLAELKK